MTLAGGGGGGGGHRRRAVNAIRWHAAPVAAAAQRASWRPRTRRLVDIHINGELGLCSAAMSRGAGPERAARSLRTRSFISGAPASAAASAVRRRLPRRPPMSSKRLRAPSDVCGKFGRRRSSEEGLSAGAESKLNFIVQLQAEDATNALKLLQLLKLLKLLVPAEALKKSRRETCGNSPLKLLVSRDSSGPEEPGKVLNAPEHIVSPSAQFTSSRPAGKDQTRWPPHFDLSILMDPAGESTSCQRECGHAPFPSRPIATLRD
ncbi:uncharacterized protein V6R79_009379 [Siganus canaliculatus]